MTSQPPIHLRAWQRAAFDAFTTSDSPDFLAVATPGAGKTTFALTCARATLAQWWSDSGGAQTPSPLVVVAPTTHLKTQWSQAAHKMGLELDPNWTPSDGLSRDVHGLVTTYQQIATGDAAARLNALSADGFIILDEIHHAGQDRAWGDSVRIAFAHSRRRLSLSGTPFRSDSAQIPFVNYEVTAQGDLARSDYTYGYADALRDGGVVRPVYFPRVDGQMEWSTASGDTIRANFSDELARDQVSQRLRTALSLDGDWLPTVLHQAHRRLEMIRANQREAGGLVIAMDQDHAQGIAQWLRQELRTAADVVVSDDPKASGKIAEFAAGDRAWLVAVRMVSEGVDIPRLRVGVYATTTATELFFRQAVGRFVRWQSGLASQKAYVFIPDDPRLRAHAFTIAEARRHVLRPPSGEDDDTSATDGAELDPLTSHDEFGEQLSLFSVVSATATGITMHAVTGEGTLGGTEMEYFDNEPEIPEPDASLDPRLAIDLPMLPTAAGTVTDTTDTSTLSVAERREDLRVRNADLARRIVDLTGWNHARVNAEMNRLAGVTKVSTATVDQLERRIRYSESWLRRLRRV
jgi:superfamily II DNA or RNA helicase